MPEFSSTQENGYKNELTPFFKQLEKGTARDLESMRTNSTPIELTEEQQNIIKLRVKEYELYKASLSDKDRENLEEMKRRAFTDKGALNILSELKTKKAAGQLSENEEKRM